MKLLCQIGLHRWHKWGGTRTTGLFRQCECCGLKQEGYESSTQRGYRCIKWTALARVQGGQS